MIIDTTKFREANAKMKERVKQESSKLTNEVYMSHMITILTLDGILDFYEASQTDDSNLELQMIDILNSQNGTMSQD